MIRASGEPPVKGEWGGAGAGAGGRTWSRSGRTIIIAAISVQEGSREQESMQSDSNEGIDHLPDNDTDTVSFKRLLKETKGQSACGRCFLCQKKHTWIDLTSSEPGRNIISCEVCDVSELDWRQEVGRCPCANSVARNAVRIFSNGEWLPAQVIKVNEHSVVVEWRTANAVHYRRLKRPEETSDAKKIDQRIHHAIALRELGLPCNCQRVDVWSRIRGCWIADAVVLEPMPGSGKITVQFQDNGKTYYKDLQPDSKALRFPSSLMEQWKRDAEEAWNRMQRTNSNGMQRERGALDTSASAFACHEELLK